MTGVERGEGDVRQRFADGRTMGMGVRVRLLVESSQTESSPNSSQIFYYRVSHVLLDLGWVDFYFRVPPSCPTVQPLLPNSHQPRQNQADSGTLKIQVNQTQSTGTWVDLYMNQLVESARVNSI